MSEPQQVGGAMRAMRSRMVAKGRMVDVVGTEADIAVRQSLGTTQCAECGDSGFVRRDVELGHPDFGRALRCRACLAQSIEQRLSVLPLAFRNWTLKSFRVAVAGRGKPEQYAWLLDVVDEWLALGPDETDNWAYFFSADSSRGKTGLVVALFRALLEAGGSGMFRIVGDVLEDVRSSFGTPEASRLPGENLIHRMKTAELLVLDDIGAHRFTPWVTDDVVWPLLAHRHSENLRTIFTSNLALDELSAKLQHPRVASRIRERCGRGDWVISLDGFPNLREQ